MAGYDHSSQDREPDASSDWRTGLRDVGPYLGLGLQLAISMALFVGIGYAVDQWLGTMPWLTIAGSVVGMVAIFILIFRTGSEMNKESADRKAAKEARGGPGAAARKRREGP